MAPKRAARTVGRGAGSGGAAAAQPRPKSAQHAKHSGAAAATAAAAAAAPGRPAKRPREAEAPAAAAKYGQLAWVQGGTSSGDAQQASDGPPPARGAPPPPQRPPAPRRGAAPRAASPGPSAASSGDSSGSSGSDSEVEPPRHDAIDLTAETPPAPRPRPPPLVARQPPQAAAAPRQPPAGARGGAARAGKQAPGARAGGGGGGDTEMASPPARASLASPEQLPPPRRATRAAARAAAAPQGRAAAGAAAGGAGRQGAAAAPGGGASGSGGGGGGDAAAAYLRWVRSTLHEGLAQLRHLGPLDVLAALRGEGAEGEGEEAEEGEGAPPAPAAAPLGQARQRAAAPPPPPRPGRQQQQQEQQRQQDGEQERGQPAGFGSPMQRGAAGAGGGGAGDGGGDGGGDAAPSPMSIAAASPAPGVSPGPAYSPMAVTPDTGGRPSRGRQGVEAASNAAAEAGRGGPSGGGSQQQQQQQQQAVAGEAPRGGGGGAAQGAPSPRRPPPRPRGARGQPAAVAPLSPGGGSQGGGSLPSIGFLTATEVLERVERLARETDAICAAAAAEEEPAAGALPPPQQQQQQQQQPMSPPARVTRAAAAAAAGDAGAGPSAGPSGAQPPPALPPLAPPAAGQQQQQAQTAAQAAAAPGARPQVSQSEAGLVLPPEAADLGFFDRGPPVCESFPFQADAIAFAEWCNAAGPDLAATRATNFRSFGERWAALQHHMARLTPGWRRGGGVAEWAQQQQQQQQGQRQQTVQGQQGQGQAGGPQAQPAAAHPGGEGGAAGGAAAGGGGAVPFVRDTWSLWGKHRSKGLLGRHLYEIIWERRPCHLYFDIEYCRRANPEVRGERLVSLLVALVREEYAARWGLALQPEWVLELDSTTPDKFSRHLVVRAPGAAFRDNIAAGAFVAAVLGRREALSELYVRKPLPHGAAAPLDGAADGSNGGVGRVCVVDKGVYTKNRHFRLPWSCKGGKTALLEPTARFVMSAAARSAAPLPKEQIMLLAMICNVAPDAQPLEIAAPAPPPASARLGGAPGGLARVAEEGVIQVPEHPSLGPIVAGTTAPPGAGGSAPRCVPERAGGVGGIEEYEITRGGAGYRAVKVSWIYRQDGGDRPWRDALQQAALNAISFVEDVARRRAGGLHAAVRTVAYCGDDGAVAYSLIGPGSHACLRLERSHRSNHVFFVLDFATGQFCQKCHDPECWGYRSPWMPLPPEVWRRGALAHLVAARAAAMVEAQQAAAGGGGGGGQGGAAAGAAGAGAEQLLLDGV
ncbi:MAG: hypothetical protein J3K34DRAFT_461346 [Monoraphidium minutum]|nr:MAG: hypothetical protein J3K34DRAFT_461346 [Monoraphidium minutum]